MTEMLPDVLGYITGGERAQVGVIQAALAVRGSGIAAGRAGELFMLLQNASDANAEVVVTLHLPKQFTAEKTRLAVGVQAGAVGCVLLPINALADAAGTNTKVGVEVEAKTQAKPNRVRENTGGARFNPAGFPADRLGKIEGLKKMSFSAAKRMGRNILEVSVQVTPGGGAAPGKAPSMQWMPLWTLADTNDDRLLLNRYADSIRFKVVPQLKRDHTLKLLADETITRFQAAGYPLHPVEAWLIAKNMGLILEYAVPKEFGHPPLDAGTFNVHPQLTNSGGKLEEMPRWFKGLLRTIAREERVMANAPAAVAKMLYEDLLYDAMMLAFQQVETATGENVGDDKEMADYAERILEKLAQKSGMEFVYVYMPLVLGGVVINDKLVTKDENFIESLRQLWVIIDERRDQATDDSIDPVVEIAEQLIERSLQTYGFRRGST